MQLPISAAVINFQTPDLLDEAVRSFHQHYPEVRLLVVDNGSQDDSPDLVRRLEAELASVEALLLEENVYHGPAMHEALVRLETPYVYIFDSDTVTREGGFLEAMHEGLAADERLYGAGQVVRANRRGFRDERGAPVLASAYMLLRRDLYHQFPPFVHHGLPALFNFTAAHESGYRLLPFPIERSVDHLGRGTAERFGYGLGWRGRLDFLLNRLGF